MTERDQLLAQRCELEEKIKEINRQINESDKEFNEALGKLSEHARAGLYAIFDSLSANHLPLYDFSHHVGHLKQFRDFYDKCENRVYLLQMLNEHRSAEYNWLGLDE